MYDFVNARMMVEQHHDRPDLVLHCENCGDLQLRVLESAAGFYLGTACDCGPMARVSVNYYPTEEAVIAAAEHGMQLRLWV